MSARFLRNTSETLILCLLLCTACAPHRAMLRGTVTRVIDGDTIVMKTWDRQYIVRIAEVDAPERKQVFGTEAQQWVEAQVLGERVLLHSNTTDRYGRMVGTVALQNGNDLGLALVSSGHAWWYSKYSNNKTLRVAQTHAKESGVGLWKSKHPVPPWEFRKQEEE